MHCPACGFENATGIKFCGECGRRLGEPAKPAPARDQRSYTHALEALAAASTIGKERRLSIVGGGVPAVMAAAHLGLGDH